MAFNLSDLSNTWSTFKESVINYLNRAVDKTGDTMTGALYASKEPEIDNEVATKKYVDDFWKFQPGDNIVVGRYHCVNLSNEATYSTDSSTANIYKSGHGYQINLVSGAYGDLVGCSFIRTVSFYFLPKTNGLLKLFIPNYLTYKGSWQYYYGLKMQSVSSTYNFTYDLKVVYHLDGYEDVVLYKEENISAYSGILPDSIIGVVPIEVGISPTITFEYTITSMTASLSTIRHSSSDSRYVTFNASSNSDVGTNYIFSMGNPTLSL